MADKEGMPMSDQNDAFFDTITARTLRIVDSQNRPRIVVTTPNDASALALLDETGNACLQLLILDNVTKIVFKNPAGVTRVVVASDHETNDAAVMIYRPNGVMWFAASSGDEGEGVVTTDKAGEPVWFAPDKRTDGGSLGMVTVDLNDMLTDKFKEAQGFIMRSLDDPAGAQNSLQAWKSEMKQLLRARLGRDAAEKFDDAGTFNLIYVTPRQLIDALKALQTCVAEIVVAAEREGLS
ncbi:MAG TPA: hypothetical protein VGQ46_12385 [Thermoanaerobaculia bacterium]|jgi:hypothetical protein|nr:hypothetical protein [Thermoanaerobaculia bacterium]